MPLFLILLLEEARAARAGVRDLQRVLDDGPVHRDYAGAQHPGKVLVLLSMYIGRIGPLTLALAVSGQAEVSRVQLPSENVLIG